MPKWLLVDSIGTVNPVGDGTTQYYAICGSPGDMASFEYMVQAIARDTYTLADLLVKVYANTLNGATTLRTRKNTGNGNQSVSIGATATGTFQDTDNTDALVNGNLFNYQVVAGGTSGDIRINLISTTLATVSNNTPILGRSAGRATTTAYCPLPGGSAFYASGNSSTTEAHAQYTFRTAATLSNLRAYLMLYNSLASTLRTRINGADGNQIISVPDEGSGTFEDAVNTDNVSIGDEVCLLVTKGAATGGGTTFTAVGLTMKSSSLSRQTACGDAGIVPAQDWNETFYYGLEGALTSQATTEANVQCLTRMVFWAKNFFVNVKTNTVDGARTVTTRINGGDGNLSVSIGAAATGFFEDLVNNDALADDDLYNYKVGSGGSSGTTGFSVIGFELLQEAPAPPPAELENKSANMGSKMVAAGLI